MENWRLSRIEVELDKLKLDLDSPDVVSTSPTASDDRRSPGKVNGPERCTSAAADDLLSKIVIRPAYSRSSRRKGDASKAVAMIKEKYDSPNAVTTKSGISGGEPNRSTTDGFVVTEERSWKTPKPDICRIESQPGGQYILMGTSSTRLPLSESFPGGTTTYVGRLNSTPPAVPTTTAPWTAFDFSTAVYHPSSPAPIESPPRVSYGTRSSSRPGPPTTAVKPPPSLYLGQLMTAPQRYDPSSPGPSYPYNPSSPGPSYPYTPSGEKGTSSSPVVVVQPPDLVMVQPFVPLDSPSSGSALPDPPSDLFLQGYLLPQHQPPRSPIKPTEEDTVNFQLMPSIRRQDESFLRTIPPPESPKPPFNNSASDALDRDASSRTTDHLFRKRGEPEQVTCEPVSMETHAIRHLADSYDSRPRCYGTLKSTRTNPQRTAGEPSGDFFPPRGPPLSDDDRNQVEMFYRSHKSRVYVARREANLYFGSARRHSVVVASKSAVAVRAAAESPENWLFVKCGIPVLVLDSGESRRQRRLHIILAERGSGFVLWRDTFDHLTAYGVSPNVAFHTMHLSKDHTKLAGFYFADSSSATEFFDVLSNLTSDPDDPLLSLSNGTRKKKTTKSKDHHKRSIVSCGSNRKEKRKSIRREDISLPCCFTHVTKLDRNDGLHILLSDDSLFQQNKNESLQAEETEKSEYPSETPPSV